MFHAVPSYRLHRQSGQAVVTLPDGLGGRKDILLGRYRSKESRAAYANVVARWEMSGRRLPAPTDERRPDLPINELLERFIFHAQEHYRRPDGTPTNELADYKRTLRLVKVLFGETVAAEFGPLKLKAVREAMIRDGLCRGVINQRIGRIKRLFKWAAAEELIPHDIYAALTTVTGLARGRSTARETEPIKPVPDIFVDAILTHVLAPVRAMIELQRLTGCRPGEACAMRACDIDTSGPVWNYRPRQHKTAWRGMTRMVALGPKAQAIVKPFLTLDTQANLFSPARGLAERSVILRANRKTKVQPSQVNRRKTKPKRVPKDFYTVTAYERAIIRASDKADRLARQKAEDATVPVNVNDEDRIIPRWAPNHLRHNHATDVRRQFGLESAGAVLGHSKMSATEIYAERDASLAVRVDAEIG